MPTVAQRIQEIAQVAASEKPKLALDTCCVQYYINDPPVQPWADCLDPIFRAGLDGRVELYVSAVVVSELLAHVYFTNRLRTGYDPELNLLGIINRHFRILDVDGEIARAAGRLRGTFISGDKITLDTPDALIGATSIANGHTLFITNDAELAAALPRDNCVYMREAALELLEQRFAALCVDGSDPIMPSRRGPGLPGGPSLATLELGSVRPEGMAHWKRILADAFKVGSTLNEPCIFFVLGQRNGRRTETVEILFWQEVLNSVRPASRILRRLHDHLGYSSHTGKAENARNEVHVFCFTSICRERARQSQACFASKSDHQRTDDVWDAYLSPIWRFRDALRLPQTTWLLCEDGVARYLKAEVTSHFIQQARNVFGWEAGR